MKREMDATQADVEVKAKKHKTLHDFFGPDTKAFDKQCLGDVIARSAKKLRKPVFKAEMKTKQTKNYAYREALAQVNDSSFKLPLTDDTVDSTMAAVKAVFGDEQVRIGWIDEMSVLIGSVL